MSVLETIAAAIEIGKAVRTPLVRLLSEEEEGILFAARKSGEIYVFDPDTLTYPMLRVGGGMLGREDHPADLAAYFAAFVKLCELGYISHAGGVLYCLTSAGFEQARKIER